MTRTVFASVGPLFRRWRRTVRWRRSVAGIGRALSLGPRLKDFLRASKGATPEEFFLVKEAGVLPDLTFLAASPHYELVRPSLALESFPSDPLREFVGFQQSQLAVDFAERIARDFSEGSKAYLRNLDDFFSRFQAPSSGHLSRIAASPKRSAYLRFTHGFWDYPVRLALMSKFPDLTRRNELTFNEVYYRDAWVYSRNLDKLREAIVTGFKSGEDVLVAATLDNGAVSPREEQKILQSLAHKGVFYKFFQLSVATAFFPKEIPLVEATAAKETALNEPEAEKFASLVRQFPTVLICNPDCAALARENPARFPTQLIIEVPRFRQSTFHLASSRYWSQEVVRLIEKQTGKGPVLVISQVGRLAFALWSALLTSDVDFRLLDTGKALETLIEPLIKRGGWFSSQAGAVGQFTRFQR